MGAEDGIIPHKRSVADGDHAIDEERRLFYVGITRAQRNLTLTQARTRRSRGRDEVRLPSRFLSEISDQGLVQHDSGATLDDDGVQDYVELYRRLVG